ncbi:MAG: type III-A CRISPR-associated RAMP protein Csm3 [Nitrospirota bacterium]
MDLEFKGKYMISGNIVCETGLHIGGTTEGFEIGGLDNPVIKDPLSDHPYIPGSSLKGKLRHLLEWSLGKNPFIGKPFHFTEKGKSFSPCSCGHCQACVIFGVTPETGIKEEDPKEGSFAVFYKVKEEGKEEVTYRVTGPSRLTIRDSFPTEETLSELRKSLGENIYTELKTENALDRITAESNPRTMERVPAGSKFSFDAIFDMYNGKDRELLKYLFMSMHLLQNSTLGGSGSRGSGRVKFENLTVEFRPVTYYQTGNGKKTIDIKGSKTLEQLLSNFEVIDWGI